MWLTRLDRGSMASRVASIGFLIVGLIVVATAGSAGRVAANELRLESAASAGRNATADRGSAADLLEAERQGLVAVRFIPADSRSAQVIVTNRTKKPLTLRLPAAFVGVPVLAQMAAGPMANAGFANAGANAAPQTVGGMPAGGAFSIPPEKTRVVKVRTVCLEHGKPEPRPRHSYRLDRLESFSSDPALRGVMESLSRHEISSQVAQAAAWHLASGLSWEQLADERIDHVIDEDEPYFTEAEIVAARQVVEFAKRAVATKNAPPSVTSPKE